MSVYSKFNQFIEDLHKGVHNFGSHTIKVALCNSSNAPVATDAVLADLTQIAYTNLSSRTLAGVTAEQTSGVLHLTADPLTLSASGGSVATFKYVVFYNDTPTSPADPLIAWLECDADVTLLSGEDFLIDIPTDLFTAS